jgi:hypothetical protein
VSLNSKTGFISGLPANHGSYSLKITATGGFGNSGERTYNIVIDTKFIEHRTAEVNGNLLSHRADLITS